MILLALLLVCFLMASRLSERIVEPLNKLDLDFPLRNTNTEEYAEIRPLLVRLDDQHRQLAKDREELEKASMIREQFTANASHELKTPLHVISGYAELLENGMVREEASRRLFAGKIRAESQRMSKLVEDIIDLSQLDGGGSGMGRENADLMRIAVNAAESLESAASGAGVTITVEGDNAVIYGIPQVLYSLIYNLCSNGIHYSNKGGRVLIKIRNFPDTSFAYPAKQGTPVYCFTNTYHKRRFFAHPRIVTYIDGPFYPDMDKPVKERKKELRDKVYHCMCKRAKKSNHVQIRYIKQETGK